MFIEVVLVLTLLVCCLNLLQFEALEKKIFKALEVESSNLRVVRDYICSIGDVTEELKRKLLVDDYFDIEAGKIAISETDSFRKVVKKFSLMGEAHTQVKTLYTSFDNYEKNVEDIKVFEKEADLLEEKLSKIERLSEEVGKNDYK